MGQDKSHKLKRVKNRIWKYRQILHLTQRQVSFLLALKGTSQISKWEKGVKVPSLENAMRLSKVLKTSVEELFPGIAKALSKEMSERVKTVNQDFSGLTE